MAGGDIGCGSFQGSDKSGSAFEAVLDALPLQARDWVEAARQQLDTADVVLLEVDHAQGLLPFLQDYQTRLIAEIGHDDWERAARDEAASLDDVAAKWGAGQGWRLYCVRDLVRACEQAAVEQQPVYIAFS
ncbi:hypothetical protein [Pseudomonas sp. PAMC 25886]|jgi:hypothetical protein|uniref:hypothetical protein n=1 Tax=Pseudomonas sp. PAMC 25886 TaxID=1125977 RepID=UPI000289DD60|nr:hypothetical protein [Pseudomonas sp. PAMC 25886]